MHARWLLLGVVMLAGTLGHAAETREVHLRWKDNSTGAAPATGFRLYAWVNNQWTFVRDLPKAPGVDQHAVVPLEIGAHRLVIRAVNAFGEAPNSNERMTPATAPSKVRGVRRVDG